jgi:hypothetical protein
LKEELEKHPQPSVVDLTFESINLLINLMLAQAQECFCEKVTVFVNPVTNFAGYER